MLLEAQRLLGEVWSERAQKPRQGPKERARPRRVCWASKLQGWRVVGRSRDGRWRTVQRPDPSPLKLKGLGAIGRAAAKS